MKTKLILAFSICLFALVGYSQEVVKTGEEEQKVYNRVEEPPQFPGGMEALIAHIADNLKYPKAAKEAGVEGTVYVSFVVSEEGSCVDEKILRGIHPACNEEAMRVVSTMPKWTPGKQKGKAVRVQYTLPIKFAL